MLDEPSIGLHPANIEGLTGVMDDLVADGNSVVLVDHDTQILGHADWIVEMGPGGRSRWRLKLWRKALLKRLRTTRPPK